MNMSFTGYHSHKICTNVGAPTFLALALFLFGAAPLRGDDSSPVLLADKAFVQALAQKDAAAAANFLSSDFAWIDSVGKQCSRAQVLEQFPAAANADVEAQVRVYGDTAVVRANRGKVNVMRVWLKQAAGWRVVLYQEVTQVEKSEPAGGTASGDCVNPCKEIPYQPRTDSGKAAIASWQGVMKAMAENDADTYAPLIADEFTATDTYHDRPYTKADRLAQIAKQKQSGVHNAPPELLSAEMFDFGDTVLMIAREQRRGAKAYFNSRMWVKRDARWQMLFSFNTRIE
jgi:ketosteroid isomerase-like protein